MTTITGAPIDNAFRSIDGPAIPSTLQRRFAGVIALLLLVILGVVRSSIGTHLDSFTVDEPWHVVAGTAYVRTGDFHLNPEHPPLAKLWVGASMPADFVLRPDKVLSEKTQERMWVDETMFNDNDAQAAQSRARAAMWGLHGVLLVALALLLWRACGWAWAAGTLAFIAIEPTIGAHLPVVMTDLPLALTLMIAVATAALLVTQWQWRWAVACGIATGLALAAKHSALAGLCGIAFVLLVGAGSGWRDRRFRGVLARLGRLVLVAVVAVVVLWAHYGFHFHASADGHDAFNRAMPDKIAELKLAHWRAAIAFADQWQLLPRAYLWGLADTVRTGVEGRGIAEHFIWGTLHHGAMPWFAWPAVILSKLPLALLALALLGSAMLWRATLPTGTRWLLLRLLGTCTFHLFALIGSGAVWGGARHAMPIIVGTSILAGGTIAMAWQRRSRAAGVAIAALLVAAIAMTIREPRLWEYHNELVGGSANAYRYFENEGLDLGQRFGEIRRFHDANIAATGEPLYSDYWMGEVQTRAAGLNYHRRVESLQDTNVQGIYDGWFLYPMGATLPKPQWDWDPALVFKDMVFVARFGNVGVWRGHQVRPQTRAGSLYEMVQDHIYKEDGSDWALIASRLEEVATVQPQSVNAGTELGNAYLRLGDGANATRAYRRMLDQNKVPVDGLIRAQIQAQLARIATGVDPKTIEPLRNPWLE